MKTRKHSDANYQSIFINGKTLRFPIDQEKPISELSFPEFYDVSLNTWCAAGCPFCYTDAKKNGVQYSNIVEKVLSFFGMMDENQRPYQVAIGGGGEPTSHPDFVECLETFKALSIVPNYTTNGMYLDDKIIEGTKKYSGGVALSTHPHLEKTWRRATTIFAEAGIKTNLHTIISDKLSIDRFMEQYKTFNAIVDKFVLLPYRAFGRAIKKEIDYDYLTNALLSLKKEDEKEFDIKVAFGAHFYDYLNKINNMFNVSMYPPEIFSKYLLLNDTMDLFTDSFTMRPVFWTTQGIKYEKE